MYNISRRALHDWGVVFFTDCPWDSWFEVNRDRVTQEYCNTF